MIVYDFPEPVGGHKAESVADAIRASAYAADFKTYNKQNIGDPIRLLMRDNNTTGHNQSNLQAVLDAADLNAATVFDGIKLVQDSAKAEFDTLPSWAKFSAVDAESYIDTNVTDLASATVVLTKLTRMVIALRNDRWPDLET